MSGLPQSVIADGENTHKKYDRGKMKLKIGAFYLIRINSIREYENQLHYYVNYRYWYFCISED